jgi:hypothetical protein
MEAVLVGAILMAGVILIATGIVLIVVMAGTLITETAGILTMASRTGITTEIPAL